MDDWFNGVASCSPFLIEEGEAAWLHVPVGWIDIAIDGHVNHILHELQQWCSQYPISGAKGAHNLILNIIWEFIWELVGC